MGLKRSLFGCLLALAGVGTATAMGATTQAGTVSHPAIDSGSRGGGSGSDAAGTSRGCTLPDPGDDDATDADATGGGASAAQPRASHRGLGWQSLLPGAIQ